MGVVFLVVSSALMFLMAVGSAGAGGFLWFVMVLLLGLIPASIASKKGRDFYAWWAYGMLLWIIALIHSVLLKEDLKKVDEKALSSGDLRRCPFCAEIIRREALKCKHCGSDVGQSVHSETKPVVSDTDYDLLSKAKQYIRMSERGALISTVKSMQNPNVEDEQGRTLLDFAEEAGAREMRQILFNLGVTPGSRKTP